MTSARAPGDVSRAVVASLSAAGAAAVRECGLASETCPVIALKEALAREAALLQKRDDLIQQMKLLSDESEHRLLNSLQIVSGLLAMQGRCTTCAEAALQLSAASARVAAMGRIHRRLHSIDAHHGVAFKPYLEGICEDISAMVSGQEHAEAVQVDACEIMLPAETAVPLGFIVSELITNAVKYGAGEVAVRLAREGNNMCRLSVSNSGPRLPDTFAPEASKGLGMKIILSFVKQIGGELRFGCIAADQGVRFTVLFPVTQ